MIKNEIKVARLVSCLKCGGESWVWWDELDNYAGPAVETGVDDTKYACDMCDGHKVLGVLACDPPADM